MSEDIKVTRITEEEAIALYGNVGLKFTEYYKYTFIFKGEAPDGAKISVRMGGNPDDIYKFSVNNIMEVRLSNKIDRGMISHLTIHARNGVALFYGEPHSKEFNN